MAPSLEAFQTAFAHHQAGRLREAEQLYRQILEAEPNHSDALHLLGLVAHQVGDQAAAETLITRAIALVGDRATFHTNLGEVYRTQGKLEPAEQALRRALALDPDSARAHNNLGIVLAALGNDDAAAQAYRRAIALDARFAEPHNNLATLLQTAGRLDEAIDHYRQAVQIEPRYAAAYNNLGTALKTQDRLDEAADAYRQALALVPMYAEAHLNLGTIHQAQGKLAEAIACYREALRLDAGSALAHANLGTALQADGRLAEAIAHYRHALELNPQDADAYNRLGTALKQQAARLAMGEASPEIGRPPEITWPGEVELEASATEALQRIDPQYADAAQAFCRALAVDAAHADALVNLGNLLATAGDYDAALARFDRAVAANPQLGAAHLYRADVYKALRRYREAAEGYEQAIRVQPDRPEAYNSLAILYNILGKPDSAVEYCLRGIEHAPDAGPLYGNMATALGHQGRMDEALVAARKAVELRPQSCGELSNLIYGLNRVPDYDPARLFAEHLEWARRHAEPLTAQAPPHDNLAAPDRKLRVGYVSPYFREHAVNFFTEPLITSHDRAQLELFCYSDVNRPDEATRRLQQAVDHWRDVQNYSDKQLADLVRADRIDILVDLTGHIGGSRLVAFARKPAPVQVTYIGYQNTTGMSAMDYRLTDAHADPPGETDRYYKEKLVRLPGAYFCYRPAHDVPQVTPLPARSRGSVTFGSFNDFDKVTSPTLDAWLEILARVPNSRLLLLVYESAVVRRRIEQVAREQGIDPARIELFPKRPRDQYYQLVQQADIALDPIPFNGHTTTCDAIWLGVPVVMLLGRMYAARFGSSVLKAVGLDELIATSVEQYVERAVDLAGDVDRLAELRAGLRPRMAASPLLDFHGFARNVEAAYRQMWITWCRQAADEQP